MPKAPQKEATKGGSKWSNTSKPTDGVAPLANLVEARDKNLTRHGLSEKTLGIYELRMKQGKVWLDELWKVEKEDINQKDKPWTLAELKAAFDHNPNRVSIKMVGLFINHMCFTLEYGKSMADQIQAAFKWYWSKNPRCCGDWIWDEDKGVRKGNPGSDQDILQTVKAVKSRDAEGGEHMHLAAMTKENMDQIMAWSYIQCPENILHGLMKKEEFEKICGFVAKHLWMRAFTSGAFTLWTRFDLPSFMLGHYRLNLTMANDPKWPYDECHLEHRKGWKSHIQKGGITPSNRYEIHPQPETPSIEMYTHMRNWLQFLEKYAYGRELQSDDYLFPTISASGTIRLGVPASHDLFTKWLNEFVAGAHIDQGTTKLTTHCFRHGDAQYRFQFAPLGKRWSLATVKWWGGWSEGENQDTLIRYVLDNLHNFEGHSDALRPCRCQTDISLFAKHQEDQPMPRKEMVQLWGNISQDITVKIADTFTQPTIPLPAFHVHPLPFEIHAERRNPASTSLVPPVIPAIKCSKDEPAAWRQVISHWEEADPSHGLDKPLKDWPDEWIKCSGKAQLYHQQRVIAEEYISRYHRDDSAFLSAYPAASEGVNALVDAIRGRRVKDGLVKTRKSKYGTPQQRAKERKKSS
ncbi:hypothetical protein M422DRAFT_263138 [Sphaerobolus stellatus SS14]|uniref:Uncharacterized protein n=1 Tax=Sphaerobolus stellatus (strain SS14) TaxID=990650 RepID=A0A0C9VBR7_SPHS4|nr:hypothetical protein M422DRAFT_263138 [Sphaerobolus stellatus SS14]